MAEFTNEQGVAMIEREWEKFLNKPVIAVGVLVLSQGQEEGREACQMLARLAFNAGLAAAVKVAKTKAESISKETH